MYFRTFKSQHISFSVRKDLFSHKVHSFTTAVLISQCMSSLPPVRVELQWALNNKSNLPPSCIVKFIPQILFLSDSLPVNSLVDSARIDQGFPHHFDKFSLDRYPMEVVMVNGITVIYTFNMHTYLMAESRRNPSNWAEYFFVSYTSPSFY